MRIALLLTGVVVTGFGMACLNYTTGANADHHREWASERGAPGPGGTIFLLGLACTAGGGGLVGWTIGRGRRA